MSFLESLKSVFVRREREPVKGTTLDGQPIMDFTDSPSKYADKSRFIVLGPGRKAKGFHESVKEVVQEMGHTDKVILVKDNVEIIKFGVVKTPALVIDGQVVTYGKILNADGVRELFQKYNIK